MPTPSPLQTVRDLLRLVAQTAAATHWREAGARSETAALSSFTAIYRRRWGAEIALQGARLRIARRGIVAGHAPPPAHAARDAGFDPASHVDVALASMPSDPDVGPPQGQRTRAG